MKTIKITVLLAIITMLSPTITSAQESTLEFKNAASATALVKNYIAALQNGDVDKMNAQLSKDVYIQGLGGGIDSLNYEQHKEYYTKSTSKYVHKVSRDLYLPVKVTDNWNEGEWVLSWGTNTLTNKETKKEIPIPYHTASLIADGKIIRIIYFYDMLNILVKEGLSIPTEKIH